MSVVGKFNKDIIDSDNTGKLFVVGNGINNIDRSDAFCVKQYEVQDGNRIVTHNDITHNADCIFYNEIKMSPPNLDENPHFLIERTNGTSIQSDWLRIEGWKSSPYSIRTTFDNGLSVFYTPISASSEEIDDSTNNSGFKINSNGIYQYGDYNVVRGTHPEPTNQTIIHNMPIIDNIENYSIGVPVFISDENKIYKLHEIEPINNLDNCYEYIDITDTITIYPTDPIPKVQLKDNSKFIGIVSGIYNSYEPYKIETVGSTTEFHINCPTVKVSTHGDFIFKVDNNTIEHETTSGGSKVYEVGDEVIYDGRIIDPNIPLIRKYESMIVGRITCIPKNNTKYISVFRIY